MKRFLLLFVIALPIHFASNTANAAVITYNYPQDFGVSFDASGDISALVERVPGIGEDSDFAVFTPGRIAIIERGTISFAAKIENAYAAGAVGVLILNNGLDDNLGMNLGGNVFPIPAARLSNALSEALRLELQSDPAAELTFRIRVFPQETPILQRVSSGGEPVPEPGTLAIFGLGFFSLIGGGLRRRRRCTGDCDSNVAGR